MAESLGHDAGASPQPRLSQATLNSLPKDVTVPTYDRAAVTPGIVHLGVLGALDQMTEGN